MELITIKSVTAGAIARWRKQYPDPEPHARFSDGRLIKQVGEELEALGPNPKAEDVNRIIGNDSWTRPHYCDECGKRRPAVVRLGQEPDHDSNTAHICSFCLRKALKLFEA